MGAYEGLEKREEGRRWRGRGRGGEVRRRRGRGTESAGGTLKSRITHWSKGGPKSSSQVGQ